MVVGEVCPWAIASFPGDVIVECHVDGEWQASERDDAGAPNTGCRVSDPISVSGGVVISDDYGAWGVLNDTVCATDASC